MFITIHFPGRIYILCFLNLFLLVQYTYSQQTTIIDARHYSNVFGEVRNFRIFLPPGYSKTAATKYPVIYFFHGWGQRFFGDGRDAYAGFDKGEQNNGDNIANFVATHQVIVVKPDGYNRSPGEEYYFRPYNVSPVETYRQFPIYFPELVKYIDQNYHTIADREHRAVSGLSMGGFMTFWIGAKYPDLLSAAGSFCGSPEFEVGPKDFPVEYRHIDMYKNFGGMNVRLHFGDKDFIRGYHEDMNRIWPQLMDNYEWKMYDAEHSTCGLGDMFNFLLRNFEHPPKKPDAWNHIDVYPDFSVWDYTISSDRRETGLTVLEDVNENGFRVSVRKHLPDGELLSNVKLNITTAPVYEKNRQYFINDLDLRTWKNEQTTIVSDAEGRLKLSVNGSLHEIGINKKNAMPNIRLVPLDAAHVPWITAGKEFTLDIELLNKGAVTAKNVQAKITATKNNVRISKGTAAFDAIEPNTRRAANNSFALTVTDTAEMVRLKIDLQDGNNKWVDYLVLPVRKDVPEIKDIEIADGKIFTVVNSGTDLTTEVLGTGNGDGIANPGESVVVLVKDSGKYWRTELSYGDKYLDPGGVRIRHSDNWTNFDHVGASEKYSEPLIASDCPANHQVQVFASYWTPDYPYHRIREGKIVINISGTDKTPPQIGSAQLQGDNILEAKIMDGAAIKTARAILISTDNAEKRYAFDLNDTGAGNDKAAADHIFSAIIPEQKFNMFRVIIEATDTYGNTASREMKETFLVH